MLDFVRTFARALDEEDYGAAAACLDPACRYTIGDAVLTGPDAITASYRENGDRVRGVLDGIAYESTVAESGPRSATITFTDFLTHAGRKLTHRCRQHVTVGASGLIDSIRHEDLPGEPEAVDRFFKEVGIERKSSVKAEAVPDLRAWLGDIDIYLFDQIMRGRIRPGMRVLDVGTGGGRNVHWLMRAGFDVCAMDPEADNVERVREMARSLAPALPDGNFRVESLPEPTFPKASFDALIVIAVLHFASDEAEFEAWLDSLWSLLRPGGVLFTRLASSIGLEDRVTPLGNRRYTLPDGTDRFLVDEAYLLHHTARIGGRLLDPIKTVNVQGKRCMTNWVLEKSR